MTARSANGSCTPTEFSSGGSANATGVMVTLVMRMLPALIAGSALVGFRQGREAGREDARQLLPVRLRHVGERRGGAPRGGGGGGGGGRGAGGGRGGPPPPPPPPLGGEGGGVPAPPFARSRASGW